MTDAERFLKLMADFDVAPVIESDVNGSGYVLYPGEGGVEGSGGFICEFRFDPAGKFVKVGVWE
jgi:hypothetical protein